MTYAYDILLNFEKEYFDFFEWNNSDKIIHIKKIPIIKVSKHNFNLFKNDSICFEKLFLNKIYNKTEKFYQNERNIPYAFLASNGHETIALKLNKKGINIYKSSLIFAEEEKITNIAFHLKEEKLKFKILKNKRKASFKTRKEKEIEKHIINKINNLYKNNETDKIKYLYLECYNTKVQNLNTIYKKLKYEIKNNTKKAKKINDFFSLK